MPGTTLDVNRNLKPRKKKNTMKKLMMLSSVILLTLSFFSCKKEDCEEPQCKECVQIVNLKDGLLAYYQFDGNTADSSGNSNHGIASGGLNFTTDKTGTANAAANFDGVDDYILANEASNLSPAAVTISAYYNTASEDIQALVCKRKTYNTSNTESYSGLSWSVNARSGVFSGFNNAQFGVPVNNNNCSVVTEIVASDLVYSLQNINANNWYHIVCIFENGSQRMYINGKIRQATIRNFNTLKQCTGGQLVIGAFVKDFPALFKGKLDDLRIYGRALNEEEIKELAKGY